MEGSEAESLPAEPGEADCEQATEEQLQHVASSERGSQASF
jgi:hypothetical protein